MIRKMSSGNSTLLAVGRITALIALGFVSGTIFAVPQPGSLLGLDTCEEEFTMLNPWIQCEDSHDLKKHGEYINFRGEMETYIEQQKKQGLITDVAVYFRDLENGPWFGINEEAEFAPASLLKLPVMLAILKQEQDHPGFLHNTVNSGEQGGDMLQPLSGDETVSKNTTYTVDELLERMIVYSDNASKDLLIEYLKTQNPEDDFVTSLFIELNLASEMPDGDENYMHIKNYASLFRILYNASYLDKNLSEKALELLSHTEFNDALVAGVPATVTVAHKFGIRSDISQLHDCGIVYHSDDPYLVCVMTRGRDIDINARIIKEISTRIYEEVDRK